METHTTDCLWVLGLATNSKPLSTQTTIFLIAFFFISWFALALLYWTHPGGHAWGKHYYYCYWFNKNRVCSNIPGPRGFPIFGSLNLMSKLAHHKLSKVAKEIQAKRLMALSLGETRVIVTSDPDVAKEILNSSVFADRPIKESAYSLMFNRAIGFAHYGVYWRTLRRISANHLFSPKQITSSEPQRQIIASQMVSMISRQKNELCIRSVLKRASLSNMMCSVFGRSYDLGLSCNKDETETEELNHLVEEGYDLLGKLNWSDHLPWLAGFDFQKIRFRCSELVPKVNRFVSRIIEEHKAKTGEKSNLSDDFVDVLLSLPEADKLSHQDMVSVLWEMIFRGTDTVAVLIEWILARMVLHQDIQSKIQDELDQVVGKSRPLMESDIQSLVYLPAMVKEVLRLHPPGPLLSWARLAIEDTIVDGYHVPAKTTAMVNMWAITRDPHVWEDPLSFMPERFIMKRDSCATTVDFSVFGSDLRLAPFGSGRRVCPGKALGLTTVMFWVGTLLNEFKWVPSDNHPVDLTENLRLSSEMASPLTVNAYSRHKV